VEAASDFDDVVRDAQASCGEIEVDPSQTCGLTDPKRSPRHDEHHRPIARFDRGRQ